MTCHLDMGKDGSKLLRKNCMAWSISQGLAGRVDTREEDWIQLDVYRSGKGLKSWTVDWTFGTPPRTTL